MSEPLVAIHVGGLAAGALGILLLALGILTLQRSPDRHARWYFGAFLLLVGANYIFDSMRAWSRVAGDLGLPGTLLGPETASLRVIPGLLDPPILLLFAVNYSLGRPSRAAIAALATPSFVVFGLAAPLPPFLLVRTAGLSQAGWILFLVELAVCYALAFALVARRYLLEEKPVNRDRAGVMLIVMSLAALARLPLILVDIKFSIGLPVAFQAEAAMLVLLGALFALTALVLLSNAPPSRRSHVKRLVRAMGLMLLTVGVSWTIGYAGPNVSTFSLLYPGRWFVFAGVFVLGVRHYGILDAPPRVVARLRRGLFAVVGLLFVTELAALIVMAQTDTLAQLLIMSTAFLGLGVTVYVAFRVMFPSGELAWNRLRVYRAHVELGASPEELEGLRDRLVIPVKDAEEVERAAAAERLFSHQVSLAPGSVLLGRYEIGSVVGAGTFGLVREARDRLTGEPVVLKELLPEWRRDGEALARFEREARTVLSISHPNLVQFRALERVGNGHVLVLSRVEGETVRQRIERGRLSSAEAMRLAQDVLAGLAELHHVGVVHRDVKPENIVIRPDGRAVLLDFGCVTAMGSSNGTLEAGRHPGTPAYMSPEQARGEPITPASDLYALAVVLRECLPDASREWRDVIDRGTAEAGQRWTSADAFLAALTRAQTVSRQTHR